MLKASIFQILRTFSISQFDIVIGSIFDRNKDIFKIVAPSQKRQMVIPIPPRLYELKVILVRPSNCKRKIRTKRNLKTLRSCYPTSMTWVLSTRILTDASIIFFIAESNEWGDIDE